MVKTSANYLDFCDSLTAVSFLPVPDGHDVLIRLVNSHKVLTIVLNRHATLLGIK